MVDTPWEGAPGMWSGWCEGRCGPHLDRGLSQGRSRVQRTQGPEILLTLPISPSPRPDQLRDHNFCNSRACGQLGRTAGGVRLPGDSDQMSQGIHGPSLAQVVQPQKIRDDESFSKPLPCQLGVTLTNQQPRRAPQGEG